MDNLIEMTMTVMRAERMLESLRDVRENFTDIHELDAEQLDHMIGRLEFLLEDHRDRSTDHFGLFTYVDD